MSTQVRSPLARISEASWQHTVLDGLTLFGWTVFHDRVAWRSDPGYPDLTAVHPGQRRVIWIELKTETGRLSPRQEDWRDLLLAAGQEWYCWRPSSWASAEAVMRGARLALIQRALSTTAGEDTR